MANYKQKYKDETGKKHGMLTVLRYVKTDFYNGAIFECKCDCGNIVEVPGTRLRSGGRTSCGCKRHMPRKPKSDYCVVCGSDIVYEKNMCRSCYFKQWREKKQAEEERYW